MKTNAHILAGALAELMQDLNDLARAEELGHPKGAALYQSFVNEDLAFLKRLAGAENAIEVIDSILAKF